MKPEPSWMWKPSMTVTWPAEQWGARGNFQEVSDIMVKVTSEKGDFNSDVSVLVETGDNKMQKSSERKVAVA